MKKLNKKDYINLLIIVSAFLIMVVLLIKDGNLYGSRLDWESQHVSLPEYFRTLFYQNHDLFPDFALNIGSGQNIYNFAYYGLLSPIILVSYFLPFIDMTYYLMGAAILIVITSSILFYKFLKNQGFTSNVVFITTFLFLFATSLTLHSHRHIMFMFYMPFLVLALFGVDNYFTKNKKTLLIISIFLMIMTSFYFSICGILTVLIYGIFKYIKSRKKITFKNFCLDGLKFILPILIGILIAGILILPTFNVILTNRSSSNITITLKDLILPKVNLHYLLYGSYGIGLTSISLIAIVNLFLTKQKENIFLGTVFAVLILFPIFNYILNGTMYIDAKIFIPLLPLASFIIAIFIDKLFKNKIKLKQLSLVMLIVIVLSLLNINATVEGAIGDISITLLLALLYQKTKKERHFIIPIILIAFILSFKVNQSDNLVVKDQFIGEKYQNIKSISKEITESDNSFFRISNLILNLQNINRTYNNSDYYHSTVYSSTSNQIYNKFFYDIVNNPIQMRNRAITASNTNLLFNMFIGNKYLITDSQDSILGYTLRSSSNDINIYKNENVLPIAYASSNLTSLTNFNSTKYPYNIESLLNSIVIDNQAEIFESNIEKVEFDISKLSLNELTKEQDLYQINAQKNIRLNYLLDESYKNHIIFIRFKVLKSQKCNVGDTGIIINSMKNSLTCEEWKYHNGNYQFDYQIGIADNLKMEIEILKGTYEIKDIEIYKLDYKYLDNIRADIDEFIFNTDKTKGKVIEGSINVTEDGYFTISIPYDQGFKFYVDGMLTNYEKVNTSFMGFKITKGYHDIKIVYNAPWKRVGIIISGVGVILFISSIYLERKKTKQNKTEK